MRKLFVLTYFVLSTVALEVCTAEPKSLPPVRELTSSETHDKRRIALRTDRIKEKSAPVLDGRVKSLGTGGLHKEAASAAEAKISDLAEGGVAGLSNDFCANAEAIDGIGPFSINSTSNTLDGPPACLNEGQTQIDRDEWFCWTAPQTACEGEYVVSTCGRTAVDTKIAVYPGCGCPPQPYIACSDDDCALQTNVPFFATPGAQYMIRVGVFPQSVGGSGSFTVTCRPPLPCDQPQSNCQTPTVSDALVSSRGTAVVADDFTPDASGNLTNLCWWGAYLDDDLGLDCQGLSPDSFVVKYYADNDGAPGSLLATFSQDESTLFVDGPVASGLFLPGDVTQYAYSANHAALPVLGGQCYWVEVSNGIPGCTWYWEVGINHNQRAFQNVEGGVTEGYDPAEAILDDLAFCTNLGLADSAVCLPPPPPNDNCVDATPLNLAGKVFFENSGATLDGFGHAACQASGSNLIDRDVWYCWTAPCTGKVFARTCENTEVDTRVAVYDGCSCPAESPSLLACNDDRCGEFGLQSMVVFDAVFGESYLIRLGVYPDSPGGPGNLEITCGPPPRDDCPAVGPCCEGRSDAGCGNDYCCAAVCACDPFCCEVSWDAACSGAGFGENGCGAGDLCNCDATCGEPDAGNCWMPNGLPSCSNQTCCQTICACDPFCCETEWDEACATDGFGTSGCGATLLCPFSQPNCPVGAVVFDNPPSGAVDARRPHPPDDAGTLEGITTLTVLGPTGADATCFDLCETDAIGGLNSIASVSEAAGTYTITLTRPMTPGAATTISYKDNNAIETIGVFIAHPGNADGSPVADADDVSALAAALAEGGSPLPHGLFGGDADRSGVMTPLDLLTLVDLLNGAEAFEAWLDSLRPMVGPTCP